MVQAVTRSRLMEAKISQVYQGRKLLAEKWAAKVFSQGGKVLISGCWLAWVVFKITSGIQCLLKIMTKTQKKKAQLCLPKV